MKIIRYFIVVLLVLLPITAQAATYYVREDGSAANKVSATGPSSTAAACINIAVFNSETFSAGDTVYFSGLGGDITTAVVIPSGGSDANNVVTYAGDPASNPTIHGGGAVPRGVDVTSKNYVVIKDMVITNHTTDGLFIGGTSTGVIINNVQANNSGNQGFQLYNTASATYNNISASGCTDDGFSMHNATTAVINTATFSGNAQGINIIEDTTLTANNVTLSSNIEYDFWQTIATPGPTATFSGGSSDGLISVSSGIATFKSGHTFTGEVKAQGGDIIIQNCDIRCNGTVFNTISTITITGGTLDGSWSIGAAGGVINISRVSCTNTSANGVFGTTGSPSSPGILNINYSVFTGIPALKFAADSRTGNTINFYNNVVYGVGGVGRGVFVQGTANIKNNIFTGLSDTFFTVAGYMWTNTNNARYNNTSDFSGAGGADTLAITSDPLFVDAVAGDFRLAYGSPAIDAGVDVGLFKDFTGAAAPVGDGFDVGAYEFVAGSLSNYTELSNWSDLSNWTDLSNYTEL